MPAVGRTTLLGVGLWAVILAALRVVVVPPEACPGFAPQELRASAAEARDWIVRSRADDGRYLYLYDASADRVPRDYNEVRHAGVTMALYQAAGRYGDAQALAAADEGLRWMEARLLRRDGMAALLSEDRSRAKLGASALMLVALAERRLATADARYDALMREIGAFLVSLQRPDGGFHAAWLPSTGAPERGTTSRYYPGEALWALALLHEALPGERWERAARAAARYLTTRRDEDENVRFPPLADQWLAYGLAEMAEWGLGDQEMAHARRLAGRFGLFVRTEAQREHGALGTLVRGGRTARAAGLGTWVEGLAALWRLAAADERLADLRPKLEERLACAAGIMAARQIGEHEAAAYARPELVRGAWLIDGETRMDDQQHALSALLYAADALEGRTRREPDAPLPSLQRVGWSDGG